MLRREEQEPQRSAASMALRVSWLQPLTAHSRASTGPSSAQMQTQMQMQPEEEEEEDEKKQQQQRRQSREIKKKERQLRDWLGS